MEDDKPRMPQFTLWMVMLGMLISGTANTIVVKAMDITKADGRYFQHPYFQTASMFFGELCVIFVYFGQQWRKNRTRSESLIAREEASGQTKLGLKVFLFAIPAFCDTCASTLMFVALVLTTASVYQMLRGLIVVITAILSVTILKRKLYRHHYVGCTLVFFGVFIVGLSSVLFEKSSSDAKSPIVGLILLLISQIFGGLLYIAEEKFLGQISVEPILAVGIEGISGVTYYIILLLMFQWIPCDNGDLCSGPGVENTPDSFEQLGASPVLLILWLCFMLSIGLFNSTGVTVTKNASAVARSTIDTSRTILVWAISLALGWEGFIWLQLLGFVLLVPGTMIYNEILVLPWFGLKESVEAHQKANAGDKDHTIDDADEMSSNLGESSRLKPGQKKLKKEVDLEQDYNFQ